MLRRFALPLVWLALTAPAAHAALTIETTTWNVIGIDSNFKPDLEIFPVGAEVCNTGGGEETNLSTAFVWDEVNPYVDLWDINEAGDPISIVDININRAVPDLGPGACHTVYYFVKIEQVEAAFETSRDYHIEVRQDDSAFSPSISTPSGHELYIERIVSQNRNSVIDYTVGGVPIPQASANISVTPGDTFELILNAKTATNGYQQLEVFLALPPTLFTINSVESTYTADGGTDPAAGGRLYADGCGWIDDPADPNYLSNNKPCAGDKNGKYGGTIAQTYNITVANTFPNEFPVTTVIRDYSGSSYHYNNDLSGLVFFTNAVPNTTDLAVDKSIAINPDGNTYDVTISVTNEGTTTIDDKEGFVVVDDLPVGFELTDAPNPTLTGTLGDTIAYTTETDPDPLLENGDTRITWNVSSNGSLSLAPGASATLSFTMFTTGADPGSTPENCASITAGPGPTPPSSTTDPDDDASNDQSCAPIPLLPFDYGVTKTVSVSDNTATFTLTVTRLSGSQVFGVELRDTLPIGYTYEAPIEGGAPPGIPAEGIYTWPIDSLGEGDSATVAFTATINPPTNGAITDEAGLTGEFTNTVEIRTADGDILADENRNNNTATAITAPSALTVDKSLPVLPPNGYWEYTVTLDSVTSIWLEDGDIIEVTEVPLTPGMTVTSFSGPSPWTCDALTLKCSVTWDNTTLSGVADLPPLEVAVNVASAGTYINTVLVQAIRNGEVIYNTSDEDESTGVLTVILDDDAAPIPALSGPLLIVLTLLLAGWGYRRQRV